MEQTVTLDADAGLVNGIGAVSLFVCSYFVLEEDVASPHVVDYVTGL